ncbi:hypothetical protein FRB99_001590 [Tulasnella sp. 403]|nr:hypothetical protein FRB99_001590 [Tulasnella sp. 403]
MSVTALSSCIVLEILDLLRYDETRSLAEQARDLSNISLVSRRWSQASQQLLFRNVFLKTARQYASFVHVARFNTRLLNSVRQLKVTVAEGTGRSSGIIETHLIYLLEACPRLYELDLVSECTSLSPHTLAKLQDIPCRPIAFCYTNYPKTTGPRETEIPYQLCHLWRDSLEFVMLGGEPFCLLSAPLQDAFGGRLKEFRWTGFDKPSSDILVWFLGGGDPTLKFLSLDSLPDSDTFDRLMECHGPSLRSLRLRDLFDVDPTALEYCIALEEFILDRGMDQEVLKILSGEVRDAATETPRNERRSSLITHLEFGVRVPSLTNHVMEETALRLVQGGYFPRLKTVTLKQREGTWNLEGAVKRWRDMLSGTGITVVDASPMRRTPLQRKKPASRITSLVDSTSFPRLESSAVYRFMSRRRDIWVPPILEA